MPWMYFSAKYKKSYTSVIFGVTRPVHTREITFKTDTVHLHATTWMFSSLQKIGPT